MASDDRQSAQAKRPARKTPAERSEEFDEQQRKLKAEAQQRREEAKAKGSGGGRKRG